MRLGEAQRVAKGVAQRAVDPVEALGRLLRELDTLRAQALIGAAAVVGVQDQAPAGGSLGNELAYVRRRRVVVGGRPGDHQDELDVGLVGKVDSEKAHRAEVGVGVHDHPELAHVEVERLVLVEDVYEGVADSIGHGRHAR